MAFNSNDIKELLAKQFDLFSQIDTGVPRKQYFASVEKQLKTKHILILTGLRRSGKSTFLAQIATKFYSINDYYYVNFDDERFLDFQAKDFSKLHELLIELFDDRTIFFFDEIQNIAKWESFVRRLQDEGMKIYVTGSNAELMSKEFGTRLTGRNLAIEFFPFSFEEFLDFNDLSYKTQRGILDSRLRAKLKKFLTLYLENGGIPEALKYPELPILNRIYNNAIYRDIVARFNIDDDRLLRQLSYFLMSNISAPISFNKLKANLKFGSSTTVANYISHLEEAWLLFSINVFDSSVKRQMIAPKKIYSIDLGLAKEVGFNFSENKGGFLENLVFLELRRKNQDLYYYKTKNGFEVDFYIPKIKSLVQISYDISDPDTRMRELRALDSAMSELNLKEAVLVSYDTKEEIISAHGLIQVIPAYEFLLFDKAIQ